MGTVPPCRRRYPPPRGAAPSVRVKGSTAPDRPVREGPWKGKGLRGVAGPVAPHGKSRLEEEELVEGKTPAGLPPSVPGRGEVELPHRRTEFSQVVPPTDAIGEELLQQGEILFHGGAHHPAKGLLGESRGGRVDGHYPQSILRVLVLVEHLILGVGELDSPSPGLHGTVQGNPDPRHEVPLDPRPIEPHGFHHGLSIGDEGRGD